MGPYSHYFLAVKLAPLLQPGDPGAYYWGAIVPDIRHLAKIRRDHTHLKPQRMQELAGCYPQLASFLLGYQVHCLIDDVDVTEVVGKAFPLNIFRLALRKKFSQPQITVLVEMYFLQNHLVGGELSGAYNEVLSDLGITPEQASAFFEALRAYIGSRSFQAGAAALQKTGMIETGRVEKYSRAYETLQRSRIMKAIILTSVRNSRLETYTLDYVQTNLQRW